MSRNVDIVGKLLPNKADKDLFDTLFYSDDGLLLLKIIRKKDSEDHIYFEFQVDGASNNYATEEDVDEKISALGRVLTYKGNVQAISDLPELGNNPGDVWYVDEASAEYVWIVDDNVGSWEELGPVISDVPHAKKADLADEAISLQTSVGVTDETPFLFRTAGGANEIGSYSNVHKIIGASVPIIQLVKNGNFADGTTDWVGTGAAQISASNNTLTLLSSRQYGRAQQELPTVAGHKYMLKYTIKGSTVASDSLFWSLTKTSSGPSIQGISNVNLSTSFATYISIFTATDDCSYISLIDKRASDWDNVYVKEVNLIDLTQTFGTTVANRLYAIEQATAGAGIVKAKEILIKDYYPHNVTDFTHVKTSGKQNVGFNLFDITKLLQLTDWTKSGDYYAGPIGSLYVAYNNTSLIELAPNYTGRYQIYYEGYCSSGTAYPRFRFNYTDGTYSEVTLYNTSLTTKIGTSTADKVVKSITFYYGDLGTLYIKKMCISCYWDGERDGEYEEYQEWNYPCSDVTLKGIVSLDAQDNWVYNGDEYLPSGVVNENYMVVDGGDYTYSKSVVDDSHIYFGTTITGGMIPTAGSTTIIQDIRCPKYQTTVQSGWTDNTPALFIQAAGTPNNCYVIFGFSSTESEYNMTVDQFKTAMTGVKILVRMQTSTESTADEYTELQNISNWGTEKWLTSGDVVIPVGSEIFYPVDLKAKIEVAPDSPDDDDYYVMRRNSGQNSYSLLSTWLADNDYYKMQDLSSEITDVARLDYNFKKAYKIGNQVFVTMRCKNSTGSTIASASTLFTFGSSLRTGLALYLIANINNQTIVPVNLTLSGEVSLLSSLADNDYVTFTLCFAVA